MPALLIQKPGYEQILLMLKNPLIREHLMSLLVPWLCSTNVLWSVAHSAESQGLVDVETRLECLICAGFV